MLTRRAVTALFTGALGAIGVGVPPKKAQAFVEIRPIEDPFPASPYPISHTVFGNVRRHSMSWTGPRRIEHVLMDRAKFTPSEGIPTYEHLEAEVHAALLSEAMAEVTQDWLAKVRQRAPVLTTFDQGKVKDQAVFVGDLHAALPVMMHRIARDDPWANTAIMSPTALTIMQSATVSGFERRASDDKDPPFTFGPKLVGYLPVVDDRKLRILVDEYGQQDAPVLIGHVAVLPEERNAQIVRTGIKDVDFGSCAGTYEGWNAIGIEARTLSFI